MRQVTHERLQLNVLAQAIEDVLRYELGLPLMGLSKKREFDAYADALAYISRYPSLVEHFNLKDKKVWLKNLEDARE